MVFFFQKFWFIDDEADVSNNYNDSTEGMIAAVNNSNTSSDDDDEDDSFDSSFIDDDRDKSELSTSMTNQYLQSIKYVYSVCDVL